MTQIFPQLTKIPMPMKKIAVVIGHDKTSPGAYSPHLGQSEYIYNSEVATHLSKIADIYKRPMGGGYKTQMTNLANEINKKDYDLVVELHFNAFNKIANGCEAVIFKGNKNTETIGKRFCDLITKEYNTKSRGVKEISQQNDRGYWFLALMKADALILEPFFGDNEESLKFNDPAKYADVLAKILIMANSTQLKTK